MIKKPLFHSIHSTKIDVVSLHLPNQENILLGEEKCQIDYTYWTKRQMKMAVACLRVNTNLLPKIKKYTKITFKKLLDYKMDLYNLPFCYP